MKQVRSWSARGRLTRVICGLACGWIACGWIASCGSNPAGPGGSIVSGTVVLVATLTDSVGSLLGERRVTDATGLPIELVRGDSVLATVPSQNGAFRFTAVNRGSYVVRTEVVAAPAVELPVLVQGSSIQLGAPLRIEPSPNLLTYPNAFRRAEGLAIECVPTIAGPVDVEALTVGLQVVWHLRFAANWPPGDLFHVHWNAIDDAQAPVAAGTYWIRARFDGHEIANLVFLK
jgi:hypothetical protein